MMIYDIPSARVHLLGTDKIVVELLLEHSGWANRAELLRGSGLSLEALDASLKQLEIKGILYRTPDNVFSLA